MHGRTAARLRFSGGTPRSASAWYQMPQDGSRWRSSSPRCGSPAATSTRSSRATTSSVRGRPRPWWGRKDPGQPGPLPVDLEL